MAEKGIIWITVKTADGSIVQRHIAENKREFIYDQLSAGLGVYTDILHAISKVRDGRRDRVGNFEEFGLEDCCEQR